MPLSDYQMSYATSYDTLVFGDNGNTVPNVDIKKVTGLFDLESRVGDREFAREDGDIGGLHRVAPRYPNLELEVRSNTLDQTYYDLVMQTRNIFATRREPSDTDGILTFKWPGEVEQMIRCRVVRRREPREWTTEYGVLAMDIELKAADPRIYTPAFTSSGSVSGTFNVTNNGNYWAYPEMNFGAVGTAKITNNTNGDVVDIQSAPGSGSLIANIDRFIRGIPGLYIYRASVDGYAAWQQPRKPFRLNPGTNSLTLNVGSSVTVFHRDTWM